MHESFMNRERKAEFNKEIILNAAEELFHQKGFENTKIDEIAKKSEFSKATIYSYFNSKEELLDRLLHKELQKIIKKIEDILKMKLHQGEYFISICNIFLNFYEQNKVCFERMLQPFSKDYNEHTSILYKQIANDSKKINSILYDALKNFGITQFFKGENPDKASFFLWSSVMGIIQVSKNKEELIKMLYGISTQEFIDYSFKQLYIAASGNKI